MEHEASKLAKGSRFEDRYEILEELGSGSFGRVYRARQLSTGQWVAIKILSPREGVAGAPGREVERFRRETRICASLSHPNIVGLIDSGETSEGRLYAVFAHVPGETLEQALARDGALGVREAVRLMTQVLEALEYAHGKGIVHRDLKPANLMLTGSTPRRSAVVLDFGLGGLAEDRRREEWQRLTQTQEFLGTPLYASPEQLAGEPAAERSDLYAWGLVFVECLTGRHPFAEKGAVARLLAGGGEVELPDWLADHRLGELLATVTAPDPRRRDVTAEALIESLEAIAGGQLPVAPDRLPESGRRAEARRRPRPGSRRRLAAIVSADVVGYSRLMADDEDATVRTVQAYREEIDLHVRQHGGRMEFTGDNFLAEFGSAVEAVRCALEVQRVLRARNADLAAERRMEFRIGVHLGDVRIEGERLFGTGVNIAARLEGLAEPGGICLSEAVREQLHGTLELALDDLGEQRVKNIPDPVHAYRVRLDAQLRPRAPVLRATTRHWAAGAGALVLLLGAAVATWRSREPTPPINGAHVAETESVAVLPFVNMSDDSSNEYFSDGLSEEIINSLSRLKELKVAAQTSSFSFKNKNVDIPTIGLHLGVRHVLEGSVRRQGQRVRVTAQLIEAETGFHVWSNAYDREVEDVFAIQRDIARNVAQALEIVLSSDSETQLDRQSTTSLEAYEYYLQGRSYLRSPEAGSTLESAEALFEKATTIDVDYAEAYAGLCDTYLLGYERIRSTDLFEKAERACNRALTLDSAAGDVNTALGNLYRISGQYHKAEQSFKRAIALNANAVDAYDGLAMTYQRQDRLDEAERAYRRAIEIQPRFWRGHLAMGNFLFSSGRSEEAIEHFRRVTDLTPDNPLGYLNLGSAYYMIGDLEAAAAAWRRSAELLPSQVVYANMGLSFFFLGRFEEAVEMYERAIALAPEDYETWGALADAYRFAEGRGELARSAFRRAIELAEEALRVNPSDGEVTALLAHFYASAGEPERARELLARALELAPGSMYVLYDAAVTHVSLGETEQALAAIERAVEQGYPVKLLSVDAGLAPLRETEQFASLVDRGEEQQINQR